MLKAIIPWLEALILCLGWWIFFAQNRGLLVLVIISMASIVWATRIIAAQNFWQFRLSWFNLILAYSSQLLFLVLLKNQDSRYWLAFLLGLFWAGILWAWRQLFRTPLNLIQPEYFSFNKFWYYLNYWFLACSSYALVVFIDWPWWLALLILSLVGGSWGLELLLTGRATHRWLLFVWLFIMAEVLTVIYLLPISFYLAGTLATLWFYFIGETWLEKPKNFKPYLLALLTASLLILFLTFLFL